MDFFIIGGSWINSSGFGILDGNANLNFDSRECIIPASSEIFTKPLARYGRFDSLTKMGCAAAALAMRQSGLDENTHGGDTGFIISGRFECLAVDAEYYETTIQDGGILSSPNMFSYTLPGIMPGECAAYFKLRGPCFSVSEEGGIGINAFVNALRMIESGQAAKMLAGWIDYPPSVFLNRLGDTAEYKRGALFLTIESESFKNPAACIRMKFSSGRIFNEDGSEIFSIIDVFNMLKR